MANSVKWMCVAASAMLCAVESNSTQAAAPDGRAVSLYSSGIDGLLTDSMDAGLREALRRLIIDGPSLPPGTRETASKMIDIALPLILGDTAMELDIVPPAGPGDPPLAFELTSKGVRGFAAESILRRIRGVVPESNVREIGPDPDHPGVVKYQTGGSSRPMWMGVSDGMLVVSYPDAPLKDRDTFSDAGLPEGEDLLGGIRVNFSTLSPVLQMATAGSPEGAALLTSWGLMGPDAMDCVFALGGTDEAVHLAGRVTNFGTHFGHIIPAAGVTQDQLKRVPRSAACADCTRLDLATYMSGLIHGLTEAAGPGAAKELAQAKAHVQAMLGIDIHQDLLAPMGDAFTCYMSDETGGNGIMSLVCMVSLKDADTMAATLQTVQESLDRIADHEAAGYVRVMERDMLGCDKAVSIRFPGLPVPLEPTIAVADGHLVAGLFPQSVAAAVAQFDASDSLLDAVGFRHAGGHRGIGAVQVKYLDERLRAREGYGFTALIGAAIDNYTRPRRNAALEAPPVLPPFTHLTGDMSSGLCIARLEGKDLVVSGTADRSIVAQLAAGVGQFATVAPVVLPLAVLMPALAEARMAASVAHARHQAEAARAAAEHSTHQHDTFMSPDRIKRLKTIGTALDLARSEGKEARGMSDLVRGGYITRHELTVPGHDNARYLLIGGGALHGPDGEHCVVAEPTGLPVARLCLTAEGTVTRVSH